MQNYLFTIGATNGNNIFRPHSSNWLHTFLLADRAFFNSAFAPHGMWFCFEFSVQVWSYQVQLVSRRDSIKTLRWVHQGLLRRRVVHEFGHLWSRLFWLNSPCHTSTTSRPFSVYLEASIFELGYPPPLHPKVLVNISITYFCFWKRGCGEPQSQVVPQR